MSFWKPERVYPQDATPLTFRAVPSQSSRWADFARRYGFGNRGVFIAWAVDFACFALEAQDRAHEERNREMHLWDRKP